MAPVRSTPCGITPDLATVCPTGACCPGSPDFSPTIATVAADMAASILWALTGRRFGCCEITVRPCRPSSACGDTLPLPELIYYFDRYGRGLDNLGVTFGFVPLLEDGAVFNVACGCVGKCKCKADCEVYLPGPICAITEVKIAAAIINPANYTVYDHNKLVFLDGQECPPCQNYNLALGVEGTWSVKYTLGESWPAGANQMAGLLACEYGRAMTSDSTCSLPPGVQSVARQGIDIGFLDPAALADEGLTGIAIVDAWIRAANPDRLRSRPRVWSPDVPVVRRQT